MPSSLPCPDRDVLGRLLRGELPDAEAEELEQHLSGCSSCAQAAAGLTEDDPLTDVVRAGARAEAPADTSPIRKLVARLHEMPYSPPTPPPSRGRGDSPHLGPPRDPGELGTLGPYRVLRVLGRGGMGVVYEARDPALKRKVALKVLLDGRASDPGRVARFRGEGESLARLRHPNIVHVYEVGQHEGLPYLVLEYVEGPNPLKDL
jgi:hypothetical protein